MTSTNQIAAKTAANENAPRAKATLAPKDMVATVSFESVVAGTDADGKPYATFADATIVGEDGRTSRRTVVAHETYGLVHQAVSSLQPLVVTLRHVAGALRIVGVSIDGRMQFIDNRVAKAA
jgi:hypothetical protein